MDEIVKSKILETVLNSSTRGICIIDSNGVSVLINNAGLAILNYERNDILGKNFHDLVHKTKNFKISNKECIVCQSQIDGLAYNNVCTRYKKSNGEIILLQISVYPFKIESNDSWWILLLFEEITDKNLAILNLENIIEMVEQSEAGFVITDIEGNIVYVNNGYTKITGYEKKELLGKNPRILKSGKHNKEFYKRLWSTILSGNTFNDIFINRKKTGEIYYEEDIIFPIKDSSGKINKFAALKRDITKEKLLEEKLFLVQKLESIGQIASGIAHDFNNILTGINAYLEMFGYLELPQKATEVVEKINELAKRAENLVSHLLGFSRKQMFSPATTTFSALINDSLKMLRRLIPENIELVFEKNIDDECPIDIDKTQFSQIIMNLVINSRDALLGSDKDKKLIKIILDKPVLSDFDLVEEKNYQKFIKFSVYDNGTGIKEEFINKIFEPFFTTKQVGKGTGLGLASVYGIVKQNKGYIFVDTKESEYTRFDILWPCFDSNNNKKTDANKMSIFEDIHGSENILIAEDEPGLLNIVSELFEKSGYNVYKAKNGSEALEILKNTPIDFIITDLVMPELNGDKLLAEACKIGIKVPAIITTGYEKDIRKDIIDNCFNYQVVTKPYRPLNILKLVRGILDNKK